MKFDVELVRSVRRTISVSVSAENKITVRCPKYMAESKVKDFIESKQDWIWKVLKKNEARLAENRRLFEYREILIQGKRFPLIKADFNAISQDAVFIKDNSEVKNLFIERFATEFIQYAERISAKLILPANDFSVKSYKSRWGCCDRNKNISFNYLIFMLPAEMQRYIIVHELCHTQVFDHSRMFWQLVEKFEPDYKRIRKQLKNYSFIIGLY